MERNSGSAFLAALMAVLPVEPRRGLELLDAGHLDRRPPAGDLPAVILNVGKSAPLAAAAGVLQTVYPPGHPVSVIQGFDGPGAPRVSAVPLCELAHLGACAADTCLYLPPAAPQPAQCHPLDSLVSVMARLRGPDGCPWDREQTHASLRPYMLEEAYEAVEAIGSGDMAQLKDELGDVLLQVVFHAQLASERGDFRMEDVVRNLTAKLIRRHPHVFADVQVAGAADVVRNWEAIKAAEKGGVRPAGLLEGVGKGLPALSRAAKVQKKAAKVGFDWPDVQGALAKVAEELAEVQAATPENAEGEIGDLLFAVVNVARFYGVEPEVALAGTVAKFMRRFAYMEAEARRSHRSLSEMTLEEMDRLWEEAKNAEK